MKLFICVQRKSSGLFKNVINKICLPIIFIAQSAGTVEYTDCNTAER